MIRVDDAEYHISFCDHHCVSIKVLYMFVPITRQYRIYDVLYAIYYTYLVCKEMHLVVVCIDCNPDMFVFIGVDSYHI